MFLIAKSVIWAHIQRFYVYCRDWNFVWPFQLTMKEFGKVWFCSCNYGCEFDKVTRRHFYANKIIKMYNIQLNSSCLWFDHVSISCMWHALCSFDYDVTIIRHVTIWHVIYCLMRKKTNDFNKMASVQGHTISEKE